VLGLGLGHPVLGVAHRAGRLDPGLRHVLHRGGQRPLGVGHPLLGVGHLPGRILPGPGHLLGRPAHLALRLPHAADRVLHGLLGPDRRVGVVGPGVGQARLRRTHPVGGVGQRGPRRAQALGGLRGGQVQLLHRLDRGADTAEAEHHHAQPGADRGGGGADRTDRTGGAGEHRHQAGAQRGRQGDLQPEPAQADLQRGQGGHRRAGVHVHVDRGVVAVDAVQQHQDAAEFGGRPRRVGAHVDVHVLVVRQYLQLGELPLHLGDEVVDRDVHADPLVTQRDQLGPDLLQLPVRLGRVRGDLDLLDALPGRGQARLRPTRRGPAERVLVGLDLPLPGRVQLPLPVGDLLARLLQPDLVDLLRGPALRLELAVAGLLRRPAAPVDLLARRGQPVVGDLLRAAPLPVERLDVVLGAPAPHLGQPVVQVAVRAGLLLVGFVGGVRRLPVGVLDGLDHLRQVALGDPLQVVAQLAGEVLVERAGQLPAQPVQLLGDLALPVTETGNNLQMCCSGVVCHRPLLSGKIGQERAGLYRCRLGTKLNGSSPGSSGGRSGVGGGGVAGAGMPSRGDSTRATIRRCLASRRCSFTRSSAVFGRGYGFTLGALPPWAAMVAWIRSPSRSKTLVSISSSGLYSAIRNPPAPAPGGGGLSSACSASCSSWASASPYAVLRGSPSTRFSRNRQRRRRNRVTRSWPRSARSRSIGSANRFRIAQSRRLPPRCPARNASGSRR
jgi:hypothetical protein